MTKSIEQYNSTLNGTHGGSMTNLADMSEGFPEKENGGFGAMVCCTHAQGLCRMQFAPQVTPELAAYHIRKVEGGGRTRGHRERSIGARCHRAKARH